MIGVDDAHLLDGFSAHVVHQLAQTREARLVVTVRTGAGEPDAVTALWKDKLLYRLDLEPLSAAYTRFPGLSLYANSDGTAELFEPVVLRVLKFSLKFTPEQTLRVISGAG